MSTGVEWASPYRISAGGIGINPAVSPAIVAAAVSAVSGVPSTEILSKSRKVGPATCRQIVMYLMSKHSKLSSSDIGRRLGNDHTTIIHGVKKISGLITAGDDRVTQWCSGAADLILNGRPTP